MDMGNSGIPFRKSFSFTILAPIKTWQYIGDDHKKVKLQKCGQFLWLVFYGIDNNFTN